ncbi:MAG TPA: molybdenum ABC transporter ATP-binding protein [Phycisphaerae bacterium]|nr:molybdenum ABC transporter ATP-binding protein [Phycisphaerae bacterium]HRW54283.1 molybdenum ABC transporter ATP-binding protein [Phycisphaerae bacterium]
MLRVDISRRRGDFELKVAFDLPDDVRALGVVGPSGGGKTTLLNCIAGVDQPDSGRIEMDGDVWFDSESGVRRALRRRDVGYVFQEGLLFDHLSVRDNLAYGMKKRQGADSLRLMARELGVDHLLDRSPAEASGGEQRRIAIGRALLSDPRLLLLDEPLTGLDGVTAGRVLVYLRRALQRTAVPAIYVSHSPSDVMHICQRAIGVAEGRIVHAGDAASTLSVTACATQRELAELRSIVEARLVESDEASRTSVFETETGTRIVALGGSTPSDLASPCALAVFARDVVLSAEAPRRVSARNIYKGRVRRIEKTEAMAVVEIDIGAEIYSEVGYETLRELSLREGGDVYAFFKASAVQRLL